LVFRQSALYEARNAKGKALFLNVAADAIRWADLGLHPQVFPDSTWFGFLRWYSIAYISGIVLGWWYLTRLLAQPGAPMARRHADDLVFYVTLGIILGGRIGYILFYQRSMLMHPVEMLKLWEGGMSLHGGLAGVLIALVLFCRKHRLSMMRVCDFVACVTPFGLFFGRIANFVNGELWGRVTSVPWAMRFNEINPDTNTVFVGPPRHPSQLYEAGLEGIVLFVVLNWMFWRTDARYQPGRLVGTGLILYGLSRIGLETLRQPDYGLEHNWWGLTMGQTLSVPMVIVGVYLFVTAKSRRTRVESIAGEDAVA
jgi:phosphatidylglycerol:prolipoprotein diacylglycerol transferase